MIVTTSSPGIIVMNTFIVFMGCQLLHAPGTFPAQHLQGSAANGAAAVDCHPSDANFSLVSWPPMNSPDRCCPCAQAVPSSASAAMTRIARADFMTPKASWRSLRTLRGNVSEKFQPNLALGS